MRFTVFIIFGIGNVWYRYDKTSFFDDIINFESYMYILTYTWSEFRGKIDATISTEFFLPILIDFLIAWVDLCHGKCVRIGNRGAINLIMLNHGVLNYENEL